MSRTAVVLVNYNGALDTRKCLESLLLCPELPMLVVVDNTPNDQNIGSVIDCYPDAKLINAAENLGFGRGNNIGIRWVLEHTNCEFIFIFNNDATVQPDTLQILENVLDHFPNVGAVSPRILFSENQDILWYGGGEVDWKFGRGKAPGMQGSANAALALKSRNVSFASGCAMLIRRIVFEKIGGFDPRYFMYHEDVELCLRMINNGFTIKYEPEAIVLHRVQGSMRKNGDKFFSGWSPKNPNLPFYVFHGVHNSLLNMSDHAEGMNLFKFYMCYPLLLGKKIISFLLHGRGDAVIQIFKAFIVFKSSKKMPFINELTK